MDKALAGHLATPGQAPVSGEWMDPNVNWEIRLAFGFCLVLCDPEHCVSQHGILLIASYKFFSWWLVKGLWFVSANQIGLCRPDKYLLSSGYNISDAGAMHLSLRYLCLS